MSEEVQQVEAQPQEMTRELAIQQALEIALTRGLVVKGIAEVLKALEAQKVQMIFLAEDCDNEDYKNIITALAKEFKVPIVTVGGWVELKDACKLGLPSAKIEEIASKKGKEPKIKPRCSSCAIIDWGDSNESSEAKTFLLNLVKQ